MTQQSGKLDLAKADKAYYKAEGTPQLIQLDAKRYVTITDKGAPEGPVFAKATEALFTVAYAIKRISKDAGMDFTVPKLEGQWWVDSDIDALEVPREEWNWKLLIRLPDFVTANIAAEALVNAAAKKKELEQISRVVQETILEGTCVQMLHIGPYSTEPDTIKQLKAFMESNKLIQNGLHHEIYISDPRKVEPTSMKTILRFPVANI